jgi:hypothetical protein
VFEALHPQKPAGTLAIPRGNGDATATDQASVAKVAIKARLRLLQIRIFGFTHGKLEITYQ